MGKNDYKRKSYLELGEIYFWTATINNWHRLLQKDVYKDIIISSLEHLSSKGKIDVFAFVIMPNHIHFIWRVNEPNGKETAQGSFLKFTAHGFKKMLINEGAGTFISPQSPPIWRKSSACVRASARLNSPQSLRLGTLAAKTIQNHKPEVR